jgi:hypothetical protein
MPKLFISRYNLTKIQLYELLIQFAPIKDFYFTPKFSLVSFESESDFVYAKEMLKTIKKLKIEDSCEGTRVKFNLSFMSPVVIKKIFSKFGSVKVRDDVLIFKKKESAEKAIEFCNGKFINHQKVKMMSIVEDKGV